MARTAIVAISKPGSILARTLAGGLGAESTLYLEHRFLEPGDVAEEFRLPLRPVLQRLFGESPRLVLFMPVGAAVRLLAPYIRDKHQDPAVVCIDDAGGFAVSLLSGHLGGADRLAQEVAGILGATPVITSASHVTGTLAVDLLGHEFGWTLEADSPAVTRASAAVVNGEVVGIYQEAGEPEWWPGEKPLTGNIAVYSSLEDLVEAPVKAALIVTDRLGPGADGATFQQLVEDKPLVLYRPRSLVAGMGCRRGVPVEELEELMVGAFKQSNLSLRSLRCIATADLKKDEVGILALAEKYQVPVVCYTSQELNAVFERPSPNRGNDVAGSTRDSLRPTPSEKAHSLLGIWGVSEPAALLASGSRELVVPRQKTSRATIAIARKSYIDPGDQESISSDTAGA